MHIRNFTPQEKNPMCKNIFNSRVVPVTVHAAIDKGCFYLNIQLRKAKLNDKYEVDIKHV